MLVGFNLSVYRVCIAGYPLHRENGKKSLSGKTQGILNFCQNTGNLVCSSFKFPFLKVKDISIF